MKSYLNVYRKLNLAILLQLGKPSSKNQVLVAQDLCIAISSAWNYF